MSYLVFFSARTASEIRTGVKIDTPLKKGKDTNGTVYDIKMGPSGPGQMCGTCGEFEKLCPGHPGYIELPEPCFNSSYEEIIIGILQCICFDCQKPRIDTRYDSFFEYRQVAKEVSVCGECGEALPKFFFRKPKDKGKEFAPPCVMMFYDKKKKGDATELSASSVLMIFEKISGETLKVIGFNRNVDFLQERINPSPKLDTCGKANIYEFRPEALITEVLEVLSPPARPKVMVGGDQKSDDLTEAYNKITKYVSQANSIERINNDTEKKYQGLIKRIQSEYWKIVASSPKNTTSGARQVKSIADRLGGKDGRKTSNVAGKRSDYTTRSVGSSGGTDIPFEHLGFPEVFAKKLSYPEPVTEWNMKWAQKLLEEGKINSIKRDGLNYDPSRVYKDGVLTIKGVTGLKARDLLKRQLMDGDGIFFNRQPTLKEGSIQGLIVKISKDLTHKLPLAHTAPLNADFDGKKH